MNKNESIDVKTAVDHLLCILFRGRPPADVKGLIAKVNRRYRRALTNGDADWVVYAAALGWLYYHLSLIHI